MSTLGRIVDSILSTGESLGETYGSLMETRADALMTAVIWLVAILALFILLLVNPTYAFGLLVLGIGAVYLLDIDVGGGSSSGPRR